MSDRQKIHVFLGAPPPSSCPASVPDGGMEDEDRPPAGWRHLELTWRDGWLRPAAGESSPAVPPLSAHAHYLTTWTLSQALILRGRHDVQSASSPEKTPPKHSSTPPSISSSTPELFSPATPSPGASAELFSHPCPTPRVEEGGVVLEATTDGVLCSQEDATAHDSPIKSPSSKRARVSEDEAPDSTITTTRGLQSPTTLLAQCVRAGVRHSVLVAVVHPCHLKEIKVKSGPSAGTFVALASIVVTDQSGVEMKVVLWRRAAFWTLTVCPGDVLLITGTEVNEDRWRGETVLQSTFSSKLLNLGQITASASPPGSSSMLFASSSKNPTDLQNEFTTPRRRSSVVGRLLDRWVLKRCFSCLSEWRSEAESRSRSAVQLKAVVTVEQPDGQQGALLLWGAAVDWLPRFSRDRGEVELRVQLITFHFQDAPPSQNAPQVVLDSSTPLDGVVEVLSGDITYTGCGRCSAELDTDANGIYSPCYPCLPHTAVRRYYRPGVLTVSGRGCSQVCVQVPPVPLQKILEAPPDKLHRSSAPGSEVKHIQVAAQRLQTLLSLPRKTFVITIRSHFLCDENSVAISQDFTLLDLQFPG
uniref:Shieldin complex subunit 2 n=1 Tax=Stegastes partitus TaxID=144197 RepID=A0A3B5BAV5_9TELE